MIIRDLLNGIVWRIDMSWFLARLVEASDVPIRNREEALELLPKPDYSDGRTKQSFKDSTDINKILKKAQKTGSLSFAMKYDKQTFGEFAGVDLLGAYSQAERAKSIFAELPSEIRREYTRS